MSRLRLPLGLAVACLLALTGALVAVAAYVPGGRPKINRISNMGRLVAPGGRLTQLSFFPTGSATTRDGRYLWTVSGGRTANIVEITRLADGKVVQKLVGPGDRAYEGGVVLSHDGRRAFVSETHEKVIAFTVDPRTGLASERKEIAIPVAANAAPPDDFPPRSAAQGYPAGMALSADDKTLVVALNLDERAAIIDTATGAVTQQVLLRQDGKVGDRAYPRFVAISGQTVYIACEGDGAIVSFSLATPGTVTRTVPAFTDSDNVDATKRHPAGMVLSPDGSTLYLALTNDDRVLALDAANPATVKRVISVGRAEGLGTQPVGMDITADGSTLFVATAGEDVVHAVALSARSFPGAPAADGTRPTRTVAPGEEIARLPSGLYPNAVFVDQEGGALHVVAAKGSGPGPLIPNDQAADNDSASHRLIGLLQSVALPRQLPARDTALADLGVRGPGTPVPVDRVAAAPAGSPLVGPGGTGPSDKIKYVFYVVEENKSYDAYLGDAEQGNGDPCLVLWGARRVAPRQRDGRPCAVQRYVSKSAQIRSPGQIMDGSPLTPNHHKIVSDFTLLDNAYADAETSDEGHQWTSAAYASDFENRNAQAENSPAPRPSLALLYPVAAPPRGFIFDSLARQNISFFNYGEAVAGAVIPDAQLSPADQATRNSVIARTEDSSMYPSSGSIDYDILPPNRRVYDSDPGRMLDPTKEVSRLQTFKQRFSAQLAACPQPTIPTACAVPQFNYMVLPNNHGAGLGTDRHTPDALVRDGDRAVGQLVDRISHSPIWNQSAIFVVQDDAQDGADHVEAHRVTTLVASPWVKRNAVVSTHYDTVSVLRTAELILGARPGYLYDALATPMWNVFTDKPDSTPYTSVDIPNPLIDESNAPRTAGASARGATGPWVTDRVDEHVVNKAMWTYRYGTPAACPDATGGEVANAPCDTSAPLTTNPKVTP